MGIRFLCPNGHKLNVKAFLAGKRGICPDCDVRFIVPFESGGQVAAIDETDSLLAGDWEASLSAFQPLHTELAGDVWHARTAAGAQHGPATISLIKSWIAEGKVDRDSWVWKTGWLDWQRASDVFPELGAVLDVAPLGRPKSFVEESLAVQTEDDAFQNADVLSAHRRNQRRRSERSRSIALVLAVMVFILFLVLLIVLLR
jgi:hypothetical protein